MTQKSIYILLTDTGTWFSRMIKLYTRFPYNHASIALDEGLNNLYSFGRKVYRNPFSGGFVKEGVNQGVFLHQRNTTCVLYKLTVNEDEHEKILNAIYQFEILAAHYKYNLIGIFAMAINKKLKRHNAYTCSQFVATILAMSGYHQLSKCPELMRPNDFLEIPELQLIYEGKLHEYCTSEQESSALVFPTVISL